MPDITAALELAEGWVADASLILGRTGWVPALRRDKARSNLARLGPTSVALARALMAWRSRYSDAGIIEGTHAAWCDPPDCICGTATLLAWAEAAQDGRTGALGATVDNRHAPCRHPGLFAGLGDCDGRHEHEHVASLDAPAH